MIGAHEVGLQTGVLAESPMPDCLDRARRVGLDRVELSPRHLGVATDEARIERATARQDAPATATPVPDDDAVAAAERTVDRAGVTVAGYGVVRLDDAALAREHFRIADRLGADYLTAIYPFADDALPRSLVDLATEFEIDVAIHSDSTVRHCDDGARVEPTVAAVCAALDRHSHDRFGCCFDAAHFLVEAVSPERVLREYGDRIDAVHLRDASDLTLADVPGAGRLDPRWLLEMLGEYAPQTPPLVIDHLASDDDDDDGALQATVESLRAAALDGTEAGPRLG